MFASNAGPGWGGVSKSVRETYIRAADTVIAHLTAAGRLIPAGGMALTAEQVEDVRTVAGEDGELAMTGEFWAARDRLRALFPATEPAEEETKAEALTTFLEGVLDYDSADMGWHLPGDWDPTDLADAIVHAPASSPVVPAPTETGPWKLLDDVPDRISQLVDRDDDRLVRLASGQGSDWMYRTGFLKGRIASGDCYPFVAAEEG